MILRTLSSLIHHVPAAPWACGVLVYCSFQVPSNKVEQGHWRAGPTRESSEKKKLRHWLKADSCMWFACVIFFLLRSVHPSFLWNATAFALSCLIERTNLWHCLHRTTLEMYNRLPHIEACPGPGGWPEWPLMVLLSWSHNPPVHVFNFTYSVTDFTIFVIISSYAVICLLFFFKSTNFEHNLTQSCNIYEVKVWGAHYIFPNTHWIQYVSITIQDISTSLWISRYI